ncbi:hypothetical protein [Dokdonella sp.]|uniref:hypothetical protein n=1 Tax=Dokdonella sp. TaxID=2291710 RepID=UPI0025C50974|nr:hypothetical protein [Dokdonella sp.]MBX3692843.1 hypothetical protein [Dokdonella sp.]MCW5567943.1 hypothetical protein [Dokdonella sp.]
MRTSSAPFALPCITAHGDFDETVRSAMGVGVTAASCPTRYWRRHATATGQGELASQQALSGVMPVLAPTGWRG